MIDCFSTIYNSNILLRAPCDSAESFCVEIITMVLL